MSRRAKTCIAMASLCVLAGVNIAGATSAQANEYFCRPYAKAMNDGVHIGTCKDIVVLPIAS